MGRPATPPVTGVMVMVQRPRAVTRTEHLAVPVAGRHAPFTARLPVLVAFTDRVVPAGVGMVADSVRLPAVPVAARGDVQRAVRWGSPAVIRPLPLGVML